MYVCYNRKGLNSTRKTYILFIDYYYIILLSYSLHIPKKICHRTEYGDPNFLNRLIVNVNFIFCCIFALSWLLQCTCFCLLVQSTCSVLKSLNIKPPRRLVYYTIDFLCNPVLWFKMHLFSVSSQKNNNKPFLRWEWKQKNTYMATFSKSFKIAFILPCQFCNYHVMFNMHKFYIFSVYPHCNVLNWTTLWLITGGMYLTVTKQAVLIESFVEVTGILYNLEQIFLKDMHWELNKCIS
jgi:hypothetical protein